MNYDVLIAADLDIFRWLGSFQVILEYLADEPLFGFVSAAVAVMAAFLIVYKLTHSKTY